jgi:hypothetical protein
MNPLIKRLERFERYQVAAVVLAVSWCAVVIVSILNNWSLIK